MSNLKETPKEIAERINRVSLYYEFSDSMVVWTLEDAKVKTIHRLLQGLNSTEIKNINNHLNTRGQFNYVRYFTKA
jgi:hypothetical protein